MSTDDIETFIPVAHGPSAKALITKRPSWPNILWSPSCSSRRPSARSSEPRTQLLGSPLVPEDSSTTTPRKGIRPPRHRSSTDQRLT